MMLALTPIVEQLRAGGARNVEGVTEFARRVEPPRALPAYFIVPLNEDAAPNSLSGARDQRVTVSFGVLVVVAGDGRNRAQVSDALTEACKVAKDAVVGWRHPSAAAATDYAGGSLFSTEGGVVAWMMRFSTRYHERKPT